MDISLSKLQEIVKDRGAWGVAVHGVSKSWTQFSNWTTKGPQKSPPSGPQFFSSVKQVGWSRSGILNMGSTEGSFPSSTPDYISCFKVPPADSNCIQSWEPLYLMVLSQVLCLAPPDFIHLLKKKKKALGQYFIPLLASLILGTQTSLRHSDSNKPGLCKRRHHGSEGGLPGHGVTCICVKRRVGAGVWRLGKQVLLMKIRRHGWSCQSWDLAQGRRLLNQSEWAGHFLAAPRFGQAPAGQGFLAGEEERGE